MEITVHNQAQAAVLSRKCHLRNHSRALRKLVQSKAVGQGDLQATFQDITQLLSQTLDVGRVSIWLYTDDRAKIRCFDLYDRQTHCHSHGGELSITDYPAYFQALQVEQVIAAHSAHTDPRTQEFSQSYLTPLGIQSMLDTPIWLGQKIIGVVCCEHLGATRQWFLEEEVFVCSISDFVSLVVGVCDRHQKKLQLRETLQELKRTQLQLVQSEKMSSLGQLVTGIAHEINNPMGFISTNLNYVAEYTQNLFHLLNLYQQIFPSPGAEIEREIKAIDLEYILEDLPKIIASMKTGMERINTISNSLRTFSRADKDTKVSFDLHKGIDSTLLILKHRLKANENRPAIKVIKAYGELPWVECYPGQLNQVFMNLIANAIDALEGLESWQVGTLAGAEHRDDRITDHPTKPTHRLMPTIRIQTEYTDNKVIIRIADNGPGISTEVKEHIFDYLFTTKPVDKGTGLGLSISRQIVVEKHGGLLQCISAPEQGTEFLIEIPI